MDQSAIFQQGKYSLNYYSACLALVDTLRSSVHFKVRHMMIATVHGEFRTVRGDLNLNEADITQSRIDIEIDTSSIHTRDEQRDTHLRSPDFLDTERHPLLTFRPPKSKKRAPMPSASEATSAFTASPGMSNSTSTAFRLQPTIPGATFGWRPRRAPSSAEKISD
jgi:polyisoprenoid-binding protein YceI